MNQSGVTIQHSALDTILRALRTNGSSNNSANTSPPWDPSPTPISERLTTFEAKMRDGKDNRTLDAAETVGKRAVQALRTFSETQAATVLTKVQEAAKSEPGGIGQVIAEMREGGRFADLRTQFANALATDKAMAAGYDNAAAAVAKYGQERTAIEAILARRPDAAELYARFEDLDRDIVRRASATPSKAEGRSMIDDVAQKAAELLLRAIDNIRSMFSRSASPGASTGPGPSPAMSP
jgi:hypothetical protein